MKINTRTYENQAQSRKFNIAHLNITRNVSTPVQFRKLQGVYGNSVRIY